MWYDVDTRGDALENIDVSKFIWYNVDCNLGYICLCCTYRLQIGFFFEHGIPYIHSNSLVCHNFAYKNPSGSKRKIVSIRWETHFRIYGSLCFFQHMTRGITVSTSIKLIENTKSILVAKCWQLAGQVVILLSNSSLFFGGWMFKKFTVHQTDPDAHHLSSTCKQHHYIELRAFMYFHGQQFTCSGPTICVDVVFSPWGSEYSKDLSSFSHTVHRVLSALSSADPARVNCLSKQVAGRGDWEKESKTWKMSPSGMCLKRLRGGIDLF